MIRSTARASGALRPMTTGHLPPSSSVTGTRLRAAACMTRRPMVVDPVNSRWSKGSPTKVCATSGPPVTTANSLGSKDCATSSCSSEDTPGVNSEGFNRQRFPAATMPARGPKDRAIGKFQGVTTPITPNGWACRMPRVPGTPTGRPSRSRCGRIHARRCRRANFNACTAGKTSMKADSSWGRWPKSSASAAHNRRWWVTSSWMARSSRSIRRAAAGCGCARCAAR